MEDNKLAADEARRAVQHESVKAEIESDVNAEIAAHAQGATATEARREAQIAGEFRSKAVNEVVDTEREVERARGLARVSQVIDFVFYVIYALLGVAASAGVACGAQERRICAVHRERDRSFLRAV